MLQKQFVKLPTSKFDNFEKITKIIDKLDPKTSLIRCCQQNFEKFGDKLIALLNEKGFEIFLDFNLKDSPCIIIKEIEKFSKMDISIISINGFGGNQMMYAAVEALKNKDKKPLIFADFSQDFKTDSEIEQMAIDFANKAIQMGVDGVICKEAVAKNIDFNLKRELILCKTDDDLSSSTNDFKNLKASSFANAQIVLIVD